MSENRGRADMLCLLIHGRFVPLADAHVEPADATTLRTAYREEDAISMARFAEQSCTHPLMCSQTGGKSHFGSCLNDGQFDEIPNKVTNARATARRVGWA